MSNGRERKKGRLMDSQSQNISGTKLKNITKHLKFPIVIGILGGGITAYLYISLSNSGFTVSHFTGLWRSYYSSFNGSEKFVMDSILVNPDTGLKDVMEYGTEFGKREFLAKAIKSGTVLGTAFTAGFIPISLLALYLNNRFDIWLSKDFLDDKHKRGALVVNEEEYNKFQKREKIKGALVGDLAMIDEKTEGAHGIIFGSSRTGKSVLLKRMIAYILKNRPNARVIITDPKGELIAAGYNPETDFIYSLGDERTFNINSFSLISINDNGSYSEADIKKLSEIVMPRPAKESDPVWTDNPRTVFVSIVHYAIQIEYFKNGKELNNQLLIDLINELATGKIKDFSEKLKSAHGTEAAVGLLTKGSEDQQGNFVSAFITKCDYYTNLPKFELPELELSEWLSGKGQSTIYMSNGEETSDDIYGTRITLLVEAVVSKLKKLGDDSYKGESPSSGNRRTVYLFLDEFGDLPKMKQFITFMAKAAGYGGSAWIFVQEYPRIVETYGKENASVIVNNCTTKIIFREQDPETQEICSKMIGDKEIESTNSSFSSGTDSESNKEGVTNAKSEKIVRAVLATEIADLPNNHFYMKNGHYNWVKVETEWRKDRDYYPPIAEGYVEREFTFEEQFNLKPKSKNTEGNDREQKNDKNKATEGKDKVIEGNAKESIKSDSKETKNEPEEEPVNSQDWSMS